MLGADGCETALLAWPCRKPEIVCGPSGARPRLAEALGKALRRQVEFVPTPGRS